VSIAGAATARRVPSRSGRRGRTLAGPLLAVLIAFGAWTLVPLVTLLGHDGTYNGAYGIDVADLMQYMAFIRDSGQHLLISNRFDVVPDPHLFLDPVFAISGLLWRLGASIQLSLLVWVPVAAGALAAAFTAYCRRLLGTDTAVAAGVLMALLYLSPALALAHWLGGGPTLQFGTQVVGLEMFAGAYAWGGGPALALAAMPVFLLSVEKLLEPSRRARGRSGRWYGGWAAASGLLASWLHPWQGITLLVILFGLAAWGRFGRRYLTLAGPAAATLAPLVYFEVLSHTHSSWMAAAHPNGYAHFGWWLLAALAPLILTLPGLRRSRLDVAERILWLWPVAAFAVYLALDRTWFYHAFAGLSLPFAVLAVRSWRRLTRPGWLTAPVLALVLVPGLVWTVQQLIDTEGQHFFAPGEARALAFLDRVGPPGPVLAAPVPLGQAVPAFTGRQSYVGHYYWTPEYSLRAARVDALLDGRLDRTAALAVIRASRAVFLLSDCRPGRVDLDPLLGPALSARWRFGCATVYEVSAGIRQAHSIAASPVVAIGLVRNPAAARWRATAALASGPGL